MDQTNQSPKQKYRPPAVYPGLPVMHYPHALMSEQPHAAFVLAVGIGSVTLASWSPNAGLRPFSGVRHKDDPFLLTCDQAYKVSKGCWDFIPGLKCCPPEASPEATVQNLEPRRPGSETVESDIPETLREQRKIRRP